MKSLLKAPKGDPVPYPAGNFFDTSLKHEDVQRLETGTEKKINEIKSKRCQRMVQFLISEREMTLSATSFSHWCSRKGI